MTLATVSNTSTSAVTLIADYFTGVVPPTPLVTNADHDACPAATRALLHFADDIGRAVGYDREQEGRLIQDIFPVKAAERAQVSTSSKVMLGSHTETAFHPHKPRYVVLLCLRVAVTPLTRRHHGWTFVYDELLMSATTSRARSALSALHAAVKLASRRVVLKAGELLVIDNDRAVHGRTPFVPRYDGTDRWLKRALVVTALPTTDVVGRVIQTRL